MGNAPISVDDIDTLAVEIVGMLAQGEGAKALAALPALMDGARDRPRLLARAHAWCAQAHQQVGDLPSARIAVDTAITTARQVGETDALPALIQLQRQFVTPPKLPLPDTALGQACAALDAGDAERGLRLARRARTEAEAAGDVREEVLALLAIARVPDRTAEALLAARTVADRSSDQNLVAAVARAADAAGLPFTPLNFSGHHSV